MNEGIIQQHLQFMLSEFRAYDKAAIKCNGKEAVTNFEPSIYGADISLEPMDEEGSGHNLDHNLEIYPTKDSLGANLQAQAQAQAPLWPSNIYYGFTPNNEVVVAALLTPCEEATSSKLKSGKTPHPRVFKEKVIGSKEPEEDAQVQMHNVKDAQRKKCD